MTNAPLKALTEHLEALSSRDILRFADAMSLPFVHVWLDGETKYSESRDDIEILKR